MQKHTHLSNAIHCIKSPVATVWAHMDCGGLIDWAGFNDSTSTV